MAPAVEECSTLYFTIASDMALIHPAIRRAEAFIQSCGVDDQSRIPVVLRELLANAIVHGNQNLQHRKVCCRIDHVHKGEFCIAVEDEGNGFEYACLDTTLPQDPRNIKRRGYVLLASLCQRLEFNDRGNHVKAHIRLPESCWVKKQETGESTMKFTGNSGALNGPAENELEGILLSYAELCYSVSLALTHNPGNARELSENVLTWAWHRYSHDEGKTVTKRELLNRLRERYLKYYRSAKPVHAANVACAL